ncbi:dienelactone hydrolase [Paenibacillus xylanexedens]|uniref:alpha/beta hydrolase family protein n=1 Tax=Paenibacillus xylanexedens TaxID=528191 RepID=UPI001C8DD3F2|nr:dienelactone hydrolase [Paenibacillus xylanexedens]MBY0114502.1 dienelactone hydrolase [Paenibacillus xylanexedens]
MRLFEILLFFSSVFLLAIPFIFNQRIRRSALLLTSGVGIILLVIHFLVEGYRIQLVFLYGFTPLMFMFSLIKVVRSQKGVWPVSRILRVLGPLFIAIGLIVTVCFHYVFPVFDPPAPTGKLKVGTQVFHFVDPNREETFGKSETGKRELMVQVWYPAEAGTGKYTPFIPNPRILSYMAENYGLPGFTFQHLKYVSSHAYLATEVSSAQDSYPLVLANPGFGSSRFFHTSQAENLASHGYIVAVIDHTYNTFATEFPDGQITTNTTSDLFSPEHDYRTEREKRDELGKVLTADVVFALDQFELIQSGKIPSQLKGRVDLGHIGVFGHSIGGATAYDASYDPRIKAGIDLDGGLYGLHDKEGLRKPILFINSESGYEKLKMLIDHRVYTDVELERMGNTREWVDQERKDKKLELDRMRKTVAAGGQVLYIDNAEHLNFTDVQFISPIFRILGITGKIAPDRANFIINSYMLDFFDLYLKEKGGILMNEPDSRFPEVKFITPLL